MENITVKCTMGKKLGELNKNRDLEMICNRCKNKCMLSVQLSSMIQKCKVNSSRVEISLVQNGPPDTNWQHSLGGGQSSSGDSKPKAWSSGP